MLERTGDYYYDLSRYYRRYWVLTPHYIKGKSEEELEKIILSQIDDKEKEFENFVIFAYLLVITTKDSSWYEFHKKFKDLYWNLVAYDYAGYTNYWEYEDWGAYIV